MKPSKNHTGRIKFGTESSGGFRNCTVANCTFQSCRGLALEEVDGAILENITIENLAMLDVPDYAIYITTGKRNRTPGVTTNSRIRNILISNITADGVGRMSGIQIMGLPGQPIEGVRIDNVRLTSNGGGTAKDAAATPKELGTGYPEPGRLGTLPAYGIYARHVKGLELANIHCGFSTNDLRPAAVFADVQDLEIDNFKPQVAPGVQAAVFAQDVSFIIRNSPSLDKQK
jgi:polygalacturonase